MGIYWDEKRKATQQLKQIIQLKVINQKVLAEEGRLKRYWDRTKQYKENWTFQKNERKFEKQVRGEYIKTHQELDAKEAKQFRSKIWEWREHNRKAKWIYNMEKELQSLNEGSKIKIHLNSCRTRLKKVPNWKTPGHNSMHEFWFKQFTSINNRFAIEMNRFLEEINIPK